MHITQTLHPPDPTCEQSQGKVLTGDADQQASKQHLPRRSPGLWQAGTDRGDQDLCRDEELDGEADEHTERIQDLHHLVGPEEGHIKHSGQYTGWLLT